MKRVAIVRQLEIMRPIMGLFAGADQLESRLAQALMDMARIKVGDQASISLHEP